ncbi:AtzH-like domain-containing protein [Gordonia sp. CPCC 206044]|uniref:AtzH-like domain-containing protein n=1 Tax=Gordonia sp. CPCC 206044 TaxID=3140793 RepID=UPI003AF37F03
MSTRVESSVPVIDDANSALIQAFWRYEAALMANDVAALDDLFWNDEKTVRADHSAVLLGHDAIARFRAARNQGAPPRTVTDVHVRDITDDAAVILAQTCRPTGARGLQTQVWRRTDEGWKVAYAHVSASAPRDATVWRKVGAPLVAATGSGPLTGTSVAVKDLFALAGESIGGGTPHHLEHAPIEPAHAAAVDRLLACGATITGIAHTDELAYSLGGVNPHYGTPPNPAAPKRIPGGSSSGPAVAVSSGEVDLGLGTDTAGSIRVPASYQGIWGFRPSHGTIDTAGVLPLAPSFDTVGLLARDIDTLTRGADALLAPQSPEDITAVVIDPTLLGYAEPEVAQSFWAYARRIGAKIPVAHRDITGGHLEQWFLAFRTVQAHEAWQVHGQFLSEHPDAVTSDVAQRFRSAAEVTDRQAEDARAVLRTARDHLATHLGASSALLLPTASSAAPLRTSGSVERARTATLHLTCLASLSGRPALSAPCLSADAAPVGISVVGAVGCDGAVLRFGKEHLAFDV